MSVAYPLYSWLV